MKIFDFMKKSTKKNQIKQTEDSVYEKGWKELLHYETSDDDIEESLEQTVPTEEQIRNEQIEYTSSIILNKEYLKEEDIEQYIQKKYKNLLLSDADIKALISVYRAVENEDAYGNYNIREFIDEDEKNIVELVDKIILKAKEEAEKYKSEDISKFVTTDLKLISEMRKQIKINNAEREIDE